MTNKLRILNDNTVLESNASVAGAIYEYQRLFHGTPTGGTFSVGDPVNGTVSGNKGGTIAFVGDGYIDIALTGDRTGDSSLSTVDFYTPNNDSTTTETIDNTLGVSAVTTAGYRIPLYHPDFPESNYTNPNRNVIVPAKGYYQLDERNFHKLKTSITYTNPVQISCIAILNHNLTDTATVEFHVIDNTQTEVYNITITNPNQPKFNANNNYTINNGQNYLTETDRQNAYKNNNIFLFYLPSEFTVGELEIDIVDTNNTDSFIYIGNIYAGTYYEVETNMNFGWTISPVDMSNTIYALSPFSVERPSYHMLDMQFANISSNERSYWHDLYLRLGIHKDFIINLFNGAKDINDNFFTFYGRFAQNSLVFSNDYLDRYSLQVSIRESL